MGQKKIKSTFILIAGILILLSINTEAGWRDSLANSLSGDGSGGGGLEGESSQPKSSKGVLGESSPSGPKMDAASEKAQIEKEKAQAEKARIARETTRQKELEAKKAKEEAEKPLRSALADKKDLGPFVLGMSKKDLPAGKTDTFMGSMSFIPETPIVYATQPVEYAELWFKQDILTGVRLIFKAGQDNSVLVKALKSKYGENTAITRIDGADVYWWGNPNMGSWPDSLSVSVGRHDTTIVSVLAAGANIPETYKPFIEFQTERFDEKVADRRKAQQENKEAADKAKADKMKDSL